MKIHSFPEASQTKDLSVEIDGRAVPVYTAYVSKAPINRRWPGHQRELSQREPAYFVSFESDGQAEVSVTVKRPSEKAVVRPVSKNVKTEKNGSVVKFTLREHGGYTFEPDGPHGALHLFFDPPAEYAFSPKESVIRYEHGVFDIGEIRLSDNQTLYIAEDAIVYANVVSENSENVRICGRGILDNSRSVEKILFAVPVGDGQTDAGNAERKHFISLRNCKNVSVEGIIMRDSLCYNISALNCENFTVNGIKIIGCWRYNSDGIDMQNCRNCRVSDSFIRTYDDCICIKGDSGCRAVCADTLIENCVLWCDWGHALEIGYETCADEIRNIVYKNCTILRTSFDFLNIGCVDYADIHDIVYDGVRLEYTGDEKSPQYQKADGEEYADGDKKYTPEAIGAGIFHHFEYSAGNKFGRIHDILYKDLEIFNAETVKISFSGADEEHKVERIVFENLRINGKKIDDLSETEICLRFADDITIK